MTSINSTLRFWLLSTLLVLTVVSVQLSHQAQYQQEAQPLEQYGISAFSNGMRVRMSREADDGDDDEEEPTQEQIDAIRAALEKKAKVNRPAYSPPPAELNLTNVPVPVVVAEPSPVVVSTTVEETNVVAGDQVASAPIFTPTPVPLPPHLSQPQRPPRPAVFSGRAYLGGIKSVGTKSGTKSGNAADQGAVKGLANPHQSPMATFRGQFARKTKSRSQSSQSQAQAQATEAFRRPTTTPVQVAVEADLAPLAPPQSAQLVANQRPQQHQQQQQHQFHRRQEVVSAVEAAEEEEPQLSSAEIDQVLNFESQRIRRPTTTSQAAASPE